MTTKYHIITATFYLIGAFVSAYYEHIGITVICMGLLIIIRINDFQEVLIKCFEDK